MASKDGEFVKTTLLRPPRSPQSKDSGLFDNSEDTPPAIVENKGDPKSKIGFLPLPPGYNKLVIPLGNISKEIFVMVYLSVREIVDVDTNNGVGNNGKVLANIFANFE